MQYHHQLRALLSAKLGRCPRCMRSALFGTLISWAGVGLVSLVWPIPLLLIAMLVVAGSFTALLAAHLTVLLMRTATLLRTPAPEKGVTPMPEKGVADKGMVFGRREFARKLIMVGGAALGIALVGSLKAPGAAAFSNTECPYCCRDHHYKCLENAKTFSERRVCWKRYDACLEFCKSHPSSTTCSF